MSDQTPKHYQTKADSSEYQNEEINLLDLAIILTGHKKTIFFTSLAFGILAAIVSLSRPSIYTANTTILLRATEEDLVLKDSKTYVSMLKGLTVSDKMIDKFHLQQIYGTKTLKDTRAQLESATKVISGEEDGLITVMVDDRDPKRAAALANGYIEELQNLTQGLAVKEASQRRLYYENQLQMVKQQLSNAETVLTETQKKTGVSHSNVSDVSREQLMASLNALIAMKEAEIVAMPNSTTENSLTGNDPRAWLELSSLWAQLTKVETDAVMAGTAPHVELDYIRKAREVKHYEMIYEILALKFEMAKLDESENSLSFQVLGKALPPKMPEMRSGLKRTSLMVILAMFAGGLVSVLWAFFVEALKKANENSEDGMRLRQLRELLHWK